MRPQQVGRARPEIDGPRRLALAQRLQHGLQHGQGRLGLLVAALGLLLQVVDAALDRIEVGQQQFGLDRLGVGDRIDPVLDVGDVGILEAAQDVDDRVHLADVAEELVAQALAPAGAAHQAGDVDELQLRRHQLGRFGQHGAAVEPLVGDGDPADVRLDGAEGIVGRFGRRGRGQRVEEGRLADVRQADDAALEAQFSSPVLRPPAPAWAAAGSASA